MSDERLKEIKDSIDLQLEVAKHLDIYNELALEEKELYDYLDKLKKENEELKKHLKVPETCDLKTLEDYKSYYEDTTREQILEDTYIEYCAYVNLAHRYSKLKKQLEEINKMIEKCGFVNIEQVMLNYCGLLVQQKEFIKYLEDCIKELEKESLDKLQNELNLGIRDITKEILQKYKEIIGITNE